MTDSKPQTSSRKGKGKGVVCSRTAGNKTASGPDTAPAIAALPRLPLPRGRKRGDARPPAPIVPPANVAGRALVFVIAIMTFLSCLALGGVSLVRDTAAVWQSEISREATIQIRPAEGFDIENNKGRSWPGQQAIQQRKGKAALG